MRRGSHSEKGIAPVVSLDLYPGLSNPGASKVLASASRGRASAELVWSKTTGMRRDRLWGACL
jgi:hypothetical protein